MRTMFAKFAVALALLGTVVFSTATLMATDANAARCEQRYDGSGAPVGPYC